MLDKIDARGWIGISVFALVLVILLMIAFSADLRQDEFFKTVATLLVGAFIKDVVGWAYTATKQGGELAERNQALVEHAANAPVAPPPGPPAAAYAGPDLSDAPASDAPEDATWR